MLKYNYTVIEDYSNSIKLEGGWKEDVKLGVKYQMGKLIFEVNHRTVRVTDYTLDVKSFYYF